MLGRDFSGTSANIARMNIPDFTTTRPNMRDSILEALNAYYSIDEKERNRREKERLTGLEQNLTDAIKSGDEEAIKNAYAEINPSGYIQGVNDARNKRELEELKTRNSMDLETLKNQFAYNLAKDKIGWKLAADKLSDSEKRTNSIKNYEYLIGNGVPEDQARKMAFEKGNLEVNLNPFEKKRIENIAKNIDKNISESQSRINDYNRIEQLLEDKDVKTGGISGSIKKNIPTALLNSKTQELQSLINKIVPQMRPSGSGPISDKDMAIFEKATVGLDKEKEANLNIVKGRRAIDENSIAREELRAEWVGNGGQITDFDREWRNYINKNPIFSNSNGELNKNRINPYDWFSEKRNTSENINNLEDPLEFR